MEWNNKTHPYVFDRHIATGDRLTRSLLMGGYPKHFATEAEALAAFDAEPRANGEVRRSVWKSLEEFGRCKVVKSRKWKL